MLESDELVDRSTVGGDVDIGSQWLDPSFMVGSKRAKNTSALTSTATMPFNLPVVGVIIV